MKPQKKADETEISIIQISQQRATFHILGTSPLICNSMSSKARQELLLPSRKKNTAERQSTLKHDPIAEFRRAPYTNREGAPTLIRHLSTAFKSAIRSAALDIPGASKAQLGRLMYVEGESVNIYGVPKLSMSVVRQAGMNRTPDVRTRAILPEWACELSVTFTRPQLNETTVAHLIAGAGLMQGVGDWRPEKGSGNYGQFKLVGPDDEKAFTRIVKAGGYAAQQRAMETAEPYDTETEELLAWFMTETRRREMKVVNAG